MRSWEVSVVQSLLPHQSPILSLASMVGRGLGTSTIWLLFGWENIWGPGQLGPAGSWSLGWGGFCKAPLSSYMEAGVEQSGGDLGSGSPAVQSRYMATLGWGYRTHFLPRKNKSSFFFRRAGHHSEVTPSWSQGGLGPNFTWCGDFDAQKKKKSKPR